MTAARVALGVLTATAIITGLALIAVTGAQSGVTTITGPQVARQLQQQDAGYLAAARAVGLEGTDGALLSTARASCRYVDAGRSVEAQAWAVSREYAVPMGSAIVVGAAIRTQCPQHADLIGVDPARPGE